MEPLITYAGVGVGKEVVAEYGTEAVLQPAVKDTLRDLPFVAELSAGCGRIFVLVMKSKWSPAAVLFLVAHQSLSKADARRLLHAADSAASAFLEGINAGQSLSPEAAEEVGGILEAAIQAHQQQVEWKPVSPPAMYPGAPAAYLTYSDEGKPDGSPAAAWLNLLRDEEDEDEVAGGEQAADEEALKPKRKKERERRKLEREMHEKWLQAKLEARKAKRALLAGAEGGGGDSSPGGGDSSPGSARTLMKSKTPPMQLLEHCIPPRPKGGSPVLVEQTDGGRKVPQGATQFARTLTPRESLMSELTDMLNEVDGREWKRSASAGERANEARDSIETQALVAAWKEAEKAALDGAREGEGLSGPEGGAREEPVDGHAGETIIATDSVAGEIQSPAADRSSIAQNFDALCGINAAVAQYGTIMAGNGSAAAPLSSVAGSEGHALEPTAGTPGGQAAWADFSTPDWQSVDAASEHMGIASLDDNSSEGGASWQSHSSDCKAKSEGRRGWGKPPLRIFSRERRLSQAGSPLPPRNSGHRQTPEQGGSPLESQRKAAAKSFLSRLFSRRPRTPAGGPDGRKEVEEDDEEPPMLRRFSFQGARLKSKELRSGGARRTSLALGEVMRPLPHCEDEQERGACHQGADQCDDDTGEEVCSGRRASLSNAKLFAEWDEESAKDQGFWKRREHLPLRA